MYKLEDVYKTFPSGATEDYKILRAFEMGKQCSEEELKELRETVAILQDANGKLVEDRDYKVSVIKERTQRLCELAGMVEELKTCENCANRLVLAIDPPCCYCTRCYEVTTKETTDLWEKVE